MKLLIIISTIPVLIFFNKGNDYVTDLFYREFKCSNLPYEEFYDYNDNGSSSLIIQINK